MRTNIDCLFCSDLVHSCLVGSKRAVHGKQGERVHSGAVTVLKAPLARGGRSPAVCAFLQAQLQSKLAAQPYNVFAAFVKVRTAHMQCVLLLMCSAAAPKVASDRTKLLACLAAFV